MVEAAALLADLPEPVARPHSLPMVLLFILAFLMAAFPPPARGLYVRRRVGQVDMTA